MCWQQYQTQFVLPYQKNINKKLYRKGLPESRKVEYTAKLVLTFTFSLSACRLGWGKLARSLLKAQLNTANRLIVIFL